MTDRDLIAEGRELLSAATPGDWWHYGDIAHEIYPDHALKSDHEVPPVAGVVERKEDAELIVWMRNNLPALLDELERARETGKTLGGVIRHYNDIALDATGLHHLISENRDGDWQAVWENVGELGDKYQKLRADRAGELVAIAEKQQRDKARMDRVVALAEKWENATDLMTGNPSVVARAFAAEVRAALEGSDEQQ